MIVARIYPERVKYIRSGVKTFLGKELSEASRIAGLLNRHYQRLEPERSLYAAMMTAIERLTVDGWEAEGNADFGFVCVRNGDEPRLLMLTA
jgi:hypothetical protein